MLHRSPKALLVGVAAVVLALVTARLVATDLSRLHREASSSGPRVSMVIASRDLPLGITVGPDDLSVRRVHRSEVTPGALRSIDQGVGRVVTVPLLGGSPLIGRALAPRDRTGLDAVVPPGMRALTVTTDDGLHPAAGSLVDVLVTFDPTRLGMNVEPTITVAAGALVIGTGDSKPAGVALGQGEAGKARVTVMVSAEIAKRLAFAAANGVLTLALAPPEEATSQAIRPETQ